MEIVRRVSLEVIYFWGLQSIPKVSEQFEKILVLLPVVIFDSELKDDISGTLVSYYELIILELRRMVDFLTSYDLIYKLEMDALIFSE